MSDHIMKTFTEDGMMRAPTVITGDLVREARRTYNTSPIATTTFGRLMAAGPTMRTVMKGKQDPLTVKIDDDGPTRETLVMANSADGVKEYPYEPVVVLPTNQLGGLDATGAVGKGTMTVISNLGLKEPYVGQVKLVFGEVTGDIVYYYASSERVPSGAGLGVSVNRGNAVRCAGGLIVQFMPDCPKEVITALEDCLRTIGSTTGLLKEGKAPENIPT